MTKPEIKSLKKKHQPSPESKPRSKSTGAAQPDRLGQLSQAFHQEHGLSKSELINNASVQPENREADSQPDVVFQAVGIIQGAVSFPEDKKPTITVNGKEYSLFPQSVFDKKQTNQRLKHLKKHIEKTGIPNQKLLVYPHITHSIQQTHLQEISFDIIKFDHQIGIIENNLEEMEFLLSGLWQFIPICSTPCVSIFKNSHLINLKRTQNKSAIKRVKRLEPCHIPVLWENPSIQPFHYNPGLNKLDQDSPMFVQLKARFLPEQDQFQVVSEVKPPRNQPPPYLQITEEDRKAAEEAIRQNAEGVAKGAQEQTPLSLADYEQGLTAIALAKRLGVSDSTVGNQSRKSKAEFARWSRSKDPQGWAWQRYELPSATSKGKSKPRYFPIS